MNESRKHAQGAGPAPDARQDAILQAAFEVLSRHGYRRTTMLAVATAAKVSKTTLYQRFGDKAGLFRALIRSNAAASRAALEDALARDAPTRAALANFGATLLDLLLGERAAAINRAAAADAEGGGELGRALVEAGRNSVLPLLLRVFERAAERGELAHAMRPDEALACYMGVLIGDLQLKRVIGAIEAPGPDEKRARAVAAAAFVCRD